MWCSSELLLHVLLRIALIAGDRRALN